MSQATTRESKQARSNTNTSSKVLTLAEAAGYLRVPEAEVEKLATQHDLPGRKISSEWRFLRDAIDEWLRRPSPRDRLMRHAGAIKDDPHLDQMLESIYRERGRPMTEGGK